MSITLVACISGKCPQKKTTMFSTVFVVFINGCFLLLVAVLPIVLYDMYELLTKCEVKMAGYWPSSFFFACLWSETESRSINLQKKNKDNMQPS